MNHLDEGTIHAWLDGALDARQSADAQAHVARCAECSAKVAEARGLIAASSRILTALDDVPANVTPKRAAPVAKRRFRASQWGYAAAAAVVIMVLWRSGDVRQPPPGVGPIDIDAAVKAAMESIPPIATIPAVPSQPTPLSAPPPAVAQSRPTQPSRQATDAVLPGVSGSSGGGAGGARGVASAELSRALPAPATTPVAADARSVDQRFETRDRALADVAMKNEADSSSSWSGCYRIVSAPDVNKLEEVVVTSAPVANEARRRAQAQTGRATAGAATPAAAAAPAAAEKSSFAASSTSMLIRLDSVAGRPGFTARSVGRPDSLVGVFRPVSRDTARVAFLGRVPAVITKRDRVACPE